jgi:hypothetical protein
MKTEKQEVEVGGEDTQQVTGEANGKRGTAGCGRRRGAGDGKLINGLSLSGMTVTTTKLGVYTTNLACCGSTLLTLFSAHAWPT